MESFRSRLTFANVIAATALFIALGAGAYAAVNIPNDSVSPRDLNFALGGDGVTHDSKLLSTGSFQTVAQTKVRVDDQGGLLLINGAVAVDNTANPQSAEVQTRVVLHFAPGGDKPPPPEPPCCKKIEFPTTIGSDDMGTGELLISHPTEIGTYTIELQALGSGGVSFGDVSLGVESTPEA